MTPYWALFFIPLLATIVPLRVDRNLRKLLFFCFFIFCTLLVGLRYRVGGDWSGYIVLLKSVEHSNFFSVLSLSDPGYLILNWISVKIGLGIFGVNLIGGAIFTFGILVFCQKQPMPWLGLLVSIPYLIIVVGMGYSRQAIALGFVLLAFATWPEKKFIKYIFFIFVASTFHKSAIVLFPLALFINKKYTKRKLLLGIPFLLILSLYYLRGFYGSAAYNAYFLGQGYDSKGAFIRVLMSVIPAGIFLLNKDRFKRFKDDTLWYPISITLLLCAFTSFPLPTVTDRFALFLSPIQIMVYSRVSIICESKFTLTLTVLGVLLLYSLSLYVWLNYAFHSYAWVPYNSILNM